MLEETLSEKRARAGRAGAAVRMAQRSPLDGQACPVCKGPVYNAVGCRATEACKKLYSREYGMQRRLAAGMNQGDRGHPCQFCGKLTRITNTCGYCTDCRKNGASCEGCGKPMDIANRTGFCKSCLASRKVRCEECGRVTGTKRNTEHNGLCRACEARASVRAYKLQHGCADCGYNAHHTALDFDHLDPNLKLSDVTRLVTNATATRLWAEIAKCEVVCANCHRIRTHNRRVAEGRRYARG